MGRAMVEAMGEAWYVVETFPHKDATVARRLSDDLEVTAFRPTVVAHRTARRARSRRPIGVRGEKRKEVLAPMFPPFVFVRCGLTDPLRWEIERLCSRGGEPLVRGFLTLAGTLEPASVPAEMITYYAEGKRAPTRASALLRVGDRVEIMDGPFQWLCGRVTRAEANGMAVVEIEGFGRAFPVLGEAWQFRRIEAADAAAA